MSRDSLRLEMFGSAAAFAGMQGWSACSPRSWCGSVPIRRIR